MCILRIDAQQVANHGTALSGNRLKNILPWKNVHPKNIYTWKIVTPEQNQPAHDVYIHHGHVHHVQWISKPLIFQDPNPEYTKKKTIKYKI